MGDPERTVDPETGEIRTAPDGSSPTGPAVAPVGTASSDDDDADDEMVKPLPDKLARELTVWRTMALQDAVAQSPSTAFAAVLHAIVLVAFYFTSRDSCLELSLSKVSLSFPPAGLEDSTPGGSITQISEELRVGTEGDRTCTTGRSPDL